MRESKGERERGGEGEREGERRKIQTMEIRKRLPRLRAGDASNVE